MSYWRQAHEAAEPAGDPALRGWRTMTMKTVCGHGDRNPCQRCGGGWCMKDGGHSGPHTGQDHRCLWGATYEGTRDDYIRTGDLAYLDAMIQLVTL